MSRPTQHIAGSLLGLILILGIGTAWGEKAPEPEKKRIEPGEETLSLEESPREAEPSNPLGEDTVDEPSTPVNEESPFAPQTPDDFAPQDPESVPGGTADEAPEEDPNVPVRPKDIWDTVKEYLPGY